jgi:hypothetical protein
VTTLHMVGNGLPRRPSRRRPFWLTWSRIIIRRLWGSNPYGYLVLQSCNYYYYYYYYCYCYCYCCYCYYYRYVQYLLEP